MSYTHTQTLAAASGKYNALFYCFENGSLTAGNRVLLEINATYDLDGNGSTTDDRSEVTYSVELTGKAAGEIPAQRLLPYRGQYHRSRRSGLRRDGDRRRLGDTRHAVRRTGSIVRMSYRVPSCVSGGALFLSKL